MKLYHYTCAHSVSGIESSRWLRPNPHPLLPAAGPMVHLTDLDEPDRQGLGLTSYTLDCDRTEYRVTCYATEALHWSKFARKMPRDLREQFEGVPGALPMHWWVALMPVAVLKVEAVDHAAP